MTPSPLVLSHFLLIPYSIISCFIFIPCSLPSHFPPYEYSTFNHIPIHTLLSPLSLAIISSPYWPFSLIPTYPYSIPINNMIFFAFWILPDWYFYKDVVDVIYIAKLSFDNGIMRGTSADKIVMYFNGSLNQYFIDC